MLSNFLYYHISLRLRVKVVGQNSVDPIKCRKVTLLKLSSRSMFSKFLCFPFERVYYQPMTRVPNICRARVNITDLFTVTGKRLHRAPGFDL